MHHAVIYLIPCSIIPTNNTKTMKSVIALSLAAGAAAFAPSASVARSSTALAGDLSGEIGAQAPLGFWDPLDMTNVSRGDAKRLTWLAYD